MGLKAYLPYNGVNFWIDATTRQVFEAYGKGVRISTGLQRQALERERRAYPAAGVIACHCQWAADSVVADYSIDPAKVHTIPGGGNLEERSLAQLPPAAPPPPPTPEAPLRIGFLGKEWQRKGGPFLLEVVEALASSWLELLARC